MTPTAPIGRHNVFLLGKSDRKECEELYSSSSGAINSYSGEEDWQTVDLAMAFQSPLPSSLQLLTSRQCTNVKEDFEAAAKQGLKSFSFQSSSQTYPRH